MNFKNIHLGSLLKKRSEELGISPERLAKFLNCQVKDLTGMYNAETMDSGLLLRWCKILDYDFFRLYCQHLILYAPSNNKIREDHKPAGLPQFRKNIYSQELIDYILELIEKGKKTKAQVIEEYGIPKTTLYKWITKNN